jgi:hypothetical protein
MVTHYIKAPQDTKEVNTKSLPDRTDLSKLYPHAVKSTDQKTSGTMLSRSDMTRSVRKLFLVMGMSVPLPFIVATILLGYFEQNILASNIFYFLPIIILTTLVWIAVVVWAYQKIAAQIDQVGAGPPLLLGLHVSCLMIVSQPLYMLVNFLSPPAIKDLLYILSIMCSSVILAWILLWATFHRSLSSKRN